MKRGKINFSQHEKVNYSGSFENILGPSPSKDMNNNSITQTADKVSSLNNTSVQ